MLCNNQAHYGTNIVPPQPLTSVCDLLQIYDKLVSCNEQIEEIFLADE